MNSTAYRSHRLPSLVSAVLLSLSLLISGCGGGGGTTGGGAAVINDTLNLLPGGGSTTSAFSGENKSFSISGGKPPYKVYSSNQAIASLASNTVSGTTFNVVTGAVSVDTAVTLSVIDSTNRVSATGSTTLTVRPGDSVFETININGLVQKADDTGTITITVGEKDQINAGLDGLLEVVTRTPNRRLTLSAVQGNFTFLSNGIKTSTFDVTTDSSGVAKATIHGGDVTGVQYAIVKATDQISGASMQKSFSIWSTSLLFLYPSSGVIPPSSITTCEAGKTFDFYIYAGNPPYTITNNAPSVISVSSNLLTGNGKVTVTSKGVCTGASGVTVGVMDASGLQRTFTFTYTTIVGNSALAVPNVNLVLGHTSITLITGGVPPFKVTSVDPRYATASISERTLTVTPVGAVGDTTLLITDSQGTAVTPTVHVLAPGNMTIAQASVTLPKGFTGTYPLHIISGDAPYRLYIDNDTYMTIPAATLTATTFDLTRTAAVLPVGGTTPITITVIDSAGRVAQSTVTLTNN